jgi:hypothetical protein
MDKKPEPVEPVILPDVATQPHSVGATDDLTDVAAPIEKNTQSEPKKPAADVPK